MLLDTSGLLCYHHQAETQHSQARMLFDAASRKLTHGYVLAEFIPLCQARGIPRKGALAFLRELIDNPTVEVLWVDYELHDAVLALLEARPDKTYSLCDAVSFVLMYRRSYFDALTTDHHFEQEGFRCLLG